MPKRKSIWLISREYDGLAGAGGVKDVCRQLAEVLATVSEYSVSVMLPRYGFIDAEELGFKELDTRGTEIGEIAVRQFEHCFQIDMNYTIQERRETVALWHNCINNINVYLVEADRYAEKHGVYTYTAEDEAKSSWQKSGSGHYDYFAMNILLQKTALNFMLRTNDRPWVIHCQDGHAATLPAMMRELDGFRHFFAETGAVVTIHNAGLGYHQEVEDLDFAKALTGLPESVIYTNRLGAGFNPFIAASKYAVVNTVSENYGRELQETSEDIRTGWLGHSLKENGVKLQGVTNGIDPASFDTTQPTELGIAAGYDISGGTLKGKAVCKAEMLTSLNQIRQWKKVEQFGTLQNTPDAPLLTFIGRLTEQKGIDVVLAHLAEIFELEPDIQLLILGSGDKEIEKQIRSVMLDEQFAGRVCLLKGYDPDVANQVYAAGDFFLIPSSYEPCGLTDYIAQLFANLPVVHHVGGLVKVLDGITGFAYSPETGSFFVDAVQRALTVYEHPGKKLKMQQAAVNKIFSTHTWQKVMTDYIALYEQSQPHE